MPPFAQANFRAGDNSAQIEAWENSTPNPNVYECAQELIRLWYFIAHAYRAACEKTLDEFSALTATSPREAVDNVYDMHGDAIKNFEEKLPRVHYLFRVTSLLPWELVDSNHRFQKAWSIYYEANILVDLLNVRTIGQILPSQPRQEVNLLERYWRLRDQRRIECHRVMIFMVRSGAAYSNPHFIQNHYDRWCESKREVAARRLEYLAQVNQTLRPYFQDNQPGYDGIVQMEIFVDGLFDDLRERRLEFPEDEDVKDVLQWTDEDLEELKAKMEPPRPITVEAAEICGSCKKSFNTPCEIDGCHHIFCFPCIVPWIDAREKCPVCRSKADTGDLVLVDIKIKAADEDTRGDSGENERANDGKEDQEDEDAEAKLNAMLQNLALEAKPMKELIKQAKAKMGATPGNKGRDNGQV